MQRHALTTNSKSRSRHHTSAACPNTHFKREVPIPARPTREINSLESVKLCLHEKSHYYVVQRDPLLACHSQRLPHTDSDVFTVPDGLIVASYRGLVANIVVRQAHRCTESLRPWNSSKTRALHHSKKRCRSQSL
jgi:hypothetical protein